MRACHLPAAAWNNIFRCRRETFDEIGAFLQTWLDLPKRWSDGFFTGSQIGTTPPRNAGRHRPAGKAIFVLYGPLCAHIPCHQKWNLFLDGDNATLLSHSSNSRHFEHTCWAIVRCADRDAEYARLPPPYFFFFRYAVYSVCTTADTASFPDFSSPSPPIVS